MEKTLIKHSLEESSFVIAKLNKPEVHLFIEQAAEMICKAFQNGKKVIIAGNGGSLCDAMHFAEELTGYFRKDRPALPAIALSDPAHITCTGNDSGFEFVFSRALEAYGQEGDVFVGLSTSGNSKNIIQAFQMAKDRGVHTLAFLGKGGGTLNGFADLQLVIDDVKTSDRIQEAHMTIIHIIIEVIEKKLFYSDEKVDELESALKFTCR